MTNYPLLLKFANTKQVLLDVIRQTQTKPSLTMREIFNSIIYTARRFKLATFLNIVGLAAAFASFFLLMTQIVYQLTYNHGVKDYQRLYRLESNYEYHEWNYSDNVCRPFAEAIKHLPNVESVSLMRDIYSDASTLFSFKKGEKTVYYPFSLANATVLTTLRPQVLHGTINFQKDTSKKKNGLIIPASIAQQYFGSTQVAGQEMLYSSKDKLGNDSINTYRVIGVYKDFPENSELPNCIFQYMDSTYYYDFYSLYKCYVKFTTVLDSNKVKSLGDDLRQAILADLDKNADYYINNYGEEKLNDNKEIIRNTKFKFTPLSSSYFEPFTYTSGEHGFKGMMNILGLACLLIIIIATINFLNFTLAESPMRMRSLNTRLVLGAERRTMRLKLVIECVIIAVAACLVGLAICNMLHLQADDLSLADSLAVKDHWLIALLTLLLAILAGTVAGIYPSIFATSLPPAFVLKGTFGLTPQGRRLRTILVCLQLFISMLMVIYVGILFQQSRHIINSPYGFDKNLLLYSNLMDVHETADREGLKQQLLQIPNVEAVTFASTPLGTTDGHYLINSRFHGYTMNYSTIFIDYDFMHTMGITIDKGRDFNDKDATGVIINKATLRKWPWLKIGSFILTSAEDDYIDSARIIGICNDIRYGTMRVKNDQPFVFILDRYNPGEKLFMRVTAGSDMASIRQQANLLVQDFSEGKASEVIPYNDNVIGTYRNELLFFNLNYMISLFCLVFTLIGLFCLTMFESEYRRKEIGIRKVAGATTSEIVWMLCNRYGWFILICFAVAAPIAWLFGNQTLKYFAERASINWWIFPISLLVVGGIMLGTVVLQGWLAARKNPAATIKTE